MTTTNWLRSGLSSRNGFVRKGAAALLRVPKWFRSFGTTPEDLAKNPPLLVNSIPKSGTHLLVQVVEALPSTRNYGEFVSSMTSSFQFRERSAESVRRMIGRMLPGEIVRAHLYYDPRFSAQLSERNVVNYFIYRDPRDVALSGAHYARSMNRWHRLHRYFRQAGSMDDAIKLAILGLQPPVPGVDFPDVGRRFGRYKGWHKDDNCCAIRYETLQSEARPQIIREMAQFYAARAASPIDLEACVARMLEAIVPTRSHTFRRGEKAAWRKAYNQEHRRLFHEVAGDLLIELGYETDDSWVEQSEAAIH